MVEALRLIKWLPVIFPIFASSWGNGAHDAHDVVEAGAAAQQGEGYEREYGVSSDGRSSANFVGFMVCKKGEPENPLLYGEQAFRLFAQAGYRCPMLRVFGSPHKFIPLKHVKNTRKCSPQSAKAGQLPNQPSRLKSPEACAVSQDFALPARVSTLQDSRLHAISPLH